MAPVNKISVSSVRFEVSLLCSDSHSGVVVTTEGKHSADRKQNRVLAAGCSSEM